LKGGNIGFYGVCDNFMTANGLVDTGAILTLLDKTDRWHRICVDAFKRLRLPLATSEAVLADCSI
jgi:predicted nucleic acid-binding protein